MVQSLMGRKHKNISIKHRLDFITPRITKRMESARTGRVFRVVKKLRVWLPLFATGVIALLFIWPSILPNFKMRDIAKNIPDLVIDNLQFTGIDDKNRPYSLLAAQATRPAKLDRVYEMTKPEGEITLENGTWIDGRAEFGRFDEAGKTLVLKGNVRIFRDDGYQITTDEAHIDLKTNNAWGKKDVSIQGGFGTIHGEGFSFSDSGKTIIIEGPAKATLTSR